MSNWIDTDRKLPAQGVKVLCFKEGDLYVGMRFADIWVSLPFMKELGPGKPDWWMPVMVPPPWRGKMLVSAGDPNDLMEIDELEKKHPYVYEKFIKGHRSVYE